VGRFLKIGAPYFLLTSLVFWIVSYWHPWEVTLDGLAIYSRHGLISIALPGDMLPAIGFPFSVLVLTSVFLIWAASIMTAARVADDAHALPCSNCGYFPCVIPGCCPKCGALNERRNG